LFLLVWFNLISISPCIVVFLHLQDTELMEGCIVHSLRTVRGRL
jgi:hypothetical protein